MSATLTDLRIQAAAMQAQIDAAERVERTEAEAESKKARKEETDALKERTKASWARGETHVEILPPSGNYAAMVLVHENGTPPAKLGIRKFQRLMENQDAVNSAIQEYEND